MKTDLFQWYVCFACPQMCVVFKEGKDGALRWKRGEKAGKEKKVKGKDGN